MKKARTRASLLLVALLLLLTAGAAGRSAAAKSDETVWRRQALEAARTYEEWGRVDRLMRWSPLSCIAPRTRAIELRHSAAEVDSPHGRKLYSMFAKKTGFDAGGLHGVRTYLPRLKGKGSSDREPAPIGQVIVKEAHEPLEISRARYDELRRRPRAPGAVRTLDFKSSDDGQPNLRDQLVDSEAEFRPIARRAAEGAVRWYEAGPIAGLFLMMKEEPRTAGTDQGWIYATLAADRKAITAIGKIPSCMGCHQQAPHDRLFGLPAAD